MEARDRLDGESPAVSSPSEKLRQALELMEVGIRLKRVSLREQHPQADDAEIERLMLEWLCSDD